MRVAVVGLGRMGLPIANRLRQNGFSVTGCDVRPDRCALATGAGLTVSASAGAAVADADAVLTALPGTPELEDLMLGDGRLLSSIRPAAVWIDLTSTAPAVSRRLAFQAAELGIDRVDAAMGGGPTEAAAGALTLYVGGDPAVVDGCAPLLSSLATAVHRVGPAGAGVLVKLLINLLWFGQATLVAESALLAHAAGIPAARFIDLVGSGPAASRFLTEDFPSVLQGNYLPAFGLDRIVEELRALETESALSGTPFPTGSAVAAAHRAALADLGPVDGELAVVAHLEQQARRLLRDPAGTPELPPETLIKPD